jgi:next-to-BRCA1 protein 1
LIVFGEVRQLEQCSAMATFVLKIKYADTLRRITVQASPSSNGPDLSYVQLEDIIRQTFKLPPASEIAITYTDMENDVVTMTGDQDLQDACVHQGLNPLRLQVTVVGPAATIIDYTTTPFAAPRFGHHHHHHGPHPAAGGPHGGPPHGRQGRHHGGRPQQNPLLPPPPIFKSWLDSTVKLSQDTAKQTADHVAQVLQACEPLIKNAPKQVMSEVLESITKAIAAMPNGGGNNRDDLVTHPFATAPSPFSQACSINTVFGQPCLAPPGATAPSPIEEQTSSAKAPKEIGAATTGTPSAITAPEDQPVLHNGVQCDICNMSPIVGPRYKSQKEHDYDLCQACFQEHGRTEDYDRIDRPLFRPRHLHPPMFGGRMMRCPANPIYYGGRPACSMRGPQHGGTSGPYGGKPEARSTGSMLGSGGKLDARFVQDVTIFDGTELAPGTQFTKIWRLRNSGSIAWPPQTQLVHVGGDELGSVYAVTLELPEHGLAPDGEMEVSVDLVAPERPGRYVSHWRLVAPAGPKFGHRVWVLIQVLQECKQLPQMMESLVISGQDTADQQKETEVPTEEPVVSSETIANTTCVSQGEVEDGASIITDTVSIVVPPISEADLVVLDASPVAVQPQEVAEKIEYPVKSQESPAPVNIESQTDDPGKDQDEAQDADMESSELGNFSMVDMPLPSTENGFEGLSNERERLKAAAEIDSVDAVLANLEAMGFTQKNLNLDLLKKNNNDMQRTLDDLVSASEWDPMLEELEEMGFYDTEMNRRLMFKNKGSVKRVVKELVQIYKDPSISGKEQV